MIEFNNFESNRRMEVTKEEVMWAFDLLVADELISVFGANKNNPQFKIMSA